MTTEMFGETSGNLHSST